jgi:hypothetical protein
VSLTDLSTKYGDKATLALVTNTSHNVYYVKLNAAIFGGISLAVHLSKVVTTIKVIL